MTKGGIRRAIDIKAEEILDAVNRGASDEELAALEAKNDWEFIPNKSNLLMGSSQNVTSASITPKEDADKRYKGGDGSKDNPLQWGKRKFIKKEDGWYQMHDAMDMETKVEGKPNLIDSLNKHSDYTPEEVDYTKPLDPQQFLKLLSDEEKEKTAREAQLQTEEDVRKAEKIKKEEEIDAIIEGQTEEGKLLNNIKNDINKVNNSIDNSAKESVNSILGYWTDDDQGNRIYVPGTYVTEKEKLDKSLENISCISSSSLSLNSLSSSSLVPGFWLN